MELRCRRAVRLLRNSSFDHATLAARTAELNVWEDFRDELTGEKSRLANTQ